MQITDVLATRFVLSGYNQTMNQLRQMGSEFGRFGNTAQARSLAAAGSVRQFNEGVSAGGVALAGFAMRSGAALLESENLSGRVFGSMSGDIKSWSRTLQGAASMNEYEIRRQAAIFFNLATSLKIPRDEALNMSKALVQLGVDMSSFYDVPVERVMQNLASGIIGNTRALYGYGISLDQATLKNYAYKNGIAGVGTELSKQQKVVSAFGELMSQSGAAKGDFAISFDTSATNQGRQIMAQFRKELAETGVGMQEIMFTGMRMGRAVIPVIARMVDWFTRLRPEVQLTGLAFLALLGPISRFTMAMYQAQVMRGVAGSFGGFMAKKAGPAMVAGMIASTVAAGALFNKNEENREENARTLGRPPRDNVPVDQIYDRAAADEIQRREQGGLTFAGADQKIMRRAVAAGQIEVPEDEGNQGPALSTKELMGKGTPDADRGYAPGFQQYPNFVRDYRAKGGGTEAGKPYIVGEAGPEVFVPTEDGTIIPNHQLQIMKRTLTQGADLGNMEFGGFRQEGDLKADEIVRKVRRDEEALNKMKERISKGQDVSDAEARAIMMDSDNYANNISDTSFGKARNQKFDGGFVNRSLRPITNAANMGSTFSEAMVNMNLSAEAEGTYIKKGLHPHYAYYPEDNPTLLENAARSQNEKTFTLPTKLKGDVPYRAIGYSIDPIAPYQPLLASTQAVSNRFVGRDIGHIIPNAYTQGQEPNIRALTNLSSYTFGSENAEINQARGAAQASMDSTNVSEFLNPYAIGGNNELNMEASRRQLEATPGFNIEQYNSDTEGFFDTLIQDERARTGKSAGTWKKIPSLVASRQFASNKQGFGYNVPPEFYLDTYRDQRPLFDIAEEMGTDNLLRNMHFDSEGQAYNTPGEGRQSYAPLLEEWERGGADRTQYPQELQRARAIAELRNPYTLARIKADAGSGRDPRFANPDNHNKIINATTELIPESVRESRILPLVGDIKNPKREGGSAFNTFPTPDQALEGFLTDSMRITRGTNELYNPAVTGTGGNKDASLAHLLNYQQMPDEGRTGYDPRHGRVESTGRNTTDQKGIRINRELPYGFEREGHGTFNYGVDEPGRLPMDVDAEGRISGLEAEDIRINNLSERLKGTGVTPEATMQAIMNRFKFNKNDPSKAHPLWKGKQTSTTGFYYRMQEMVNNGDLRNLDVDGTKVDLGIDKIALTEEMMASFGKDKGVSEYRSQNPESLPQEMLPFLNRNAALGGGAAAEALRARAVKAGVNPNTLKDLTPGDAVLQSPLGDAFRGAGQWAKNQANFARQNPAAAASRLSLGFDVTRFGRGRQSDAQRILGGEQLEGSPMVPRDVDRLDEVRNIDEANRTPREQRDFQRLDRRHNRLTLQEMFGEREALTGRNGHLNQGQASRGQAATLPELRRNAQGPLDTIATLTQLQDDARNATPARPYGRNAVTPPRNQAQQQEYDRVVAQLEEIQRGTSNRFVAPDANGVPEIQTNEVNRAIADLTTAAARAVRPLRQAEARLVDLNTQIQTLSIAMGGTGNAAAARVGNGPLRQVGQSTSISPEEVRGAWARQNQQRMRSGLINNLMATDTVANPSRGLSGMYDEMFRRSSIAGGVEVGGAYDPLTQGRLTTTTGDEFVNGTRNNVTLPGSMLAPGAMTTHTHPDGGRVLSPGDIESAIRNNASTRNRGVEAVFDTQQGEITQRQANGLYQQRTARGRASLTFTGDMSDMTQQNTFRDTIQEGYMRGQQEAIEGRINQINDPTQRVGATRQELRALRAERAQLRTQLTQVQAGTDTFDQLPDALKVRTMDTVGDAVNRTGLGIYTRATETNVAGDFRVASDDSSIDAVRRIGSNDPNRFATSPTELGRIDRLIGLTSGSRLNRQGIGIGAKALDYMAPTSMMAEDFRGMGVGTRFGVASGISFPFSMGAGFAATQLGGDETSQFAASAGTQVGVSAAVSYGGREGGLGQVISRNSTLRGAAQSVLPRLPQGLQNYALNGGLETLTGANSSSFARRAFGTAVGPLGTAAGAYGAYNSYNMVASAESRATKEEKDYMSTQRGLSGNFQVGPTDTGISRAGLGMAGIAAVPMIGQAATWGGGMLMAGSGATGLAASGVAGAAGWTGLGGIGAAYSGVTTAASLGGAGGGVGAGIAAGAGAGAQAIGAAIGSTIAVPIAAAIGGLYAYNTSSGYSEESSNFNKAFGDMAAQDQTKALADNIKEVNAGFDGMRGGLDGLLAPMRRFATFGSFSQIGPSKADAVNIEKMQARLDARKQNNAVLKATGANESYSERATGRLAIAEYKVSPTRLRAEKKLADAKAAQAAGVDPNKIDPMKIYAGAAGQESVYGVQDDPAAGVQWRRREADGTMRDLKEGEARQAGDTANVGNWNGDAKIALENDSSIEVSSTFQGWDSERELRVKELTPEQLTQRKMQIGSNSNKQNAKTAQSNLNYVQAGERDSASAVRMQNMMVQKDIVEQAGLHGKAALKDSGFQNEVIGIAGIEGLIKLHQAKEEDFTKVAEQIAPQFRFAPNGTAAVDANGTPITGAMATANAGMAGGQRPINTNIRSNDPLNFDVEVNIVPKGEPVTAPTANT